jgi:hypothetical protein
MVDTIGDVAFSQGDIMRRLRELEAQVRELNAGRRLENASIGAGGIRVKDGGTIRSDTFDGDLAVNNPGTAGWAVGRDRMAVLGAMLQPVAAGTSGNGLDELSFPVRVAGDNRSEGTVIVPPWARVALIHTTVAASIKNTSGVTDIAYLRPVIEGELGGEMFTYLDAGKWGHVSCSDTRNLAIARGGGLLTISARLRTQLGDWTAEPGNIVQQRSTVVFMRFTESL